MIDEAQIKSLHVMVMEVPCCSGLMHIAEVTVNATNRKIPIKKTVVGVQGQILQQF
jgi:hypothetical protein